MPFSGEPLHASDRHRLARVEQVVRAARAQLAEADKAALGSDAGAGDARGAAQEEAKGAASETPDLGALRGAQPQLRAAALRCCVVFLGAPSAVLSWHIRCFFCDQGASWPRRWAPSSPSRT